MTANGRKQIVTISQFLDLNRRFREKRTLCMCGMFSAQRGCRERQAVAGIGHVNEKYSKNQGQLEFHLSISFRGIQNHRISRF